MMLNHKKRKIEAPLRIEIPRIDNNLCKEIKLIIDNNIIYKKDEIIKYLYEFKK